MKLTREQAIAVFEGWKCDGKCKQLPDELLKFGNFGFSERIRVMLATRNREASDALWDGQERIAFSLLLSAGLIPNSRRGAEKPNSRFERNRFEAGILVGRLVNAQMNASTRSAWNIVKARGKLR